MRKNRIIPLLFFGCFCPILLGPVACHRSPGNNPTEILKGEAGDDLDRKLTPLMEQFVKGYDLSGLAIGIVRGNEIVYAKAFGYSNAETGKPLTLGSLFHMASNSKPVVTTALMQLVEEGKIHLDSSLVKYLHYFRIQGGDYERITIRQMLNHYSGLPDIREYKWDNPLYHEHALERYVRSIAEEGMIGDPGERFSYSSLAFECLGDVIAKVSGKPFEVYVKKNVLDPIGMKESTFLKPQELPENWASPHTRVINCRVWEPYPYNRMHGPSSTLHSNVVEMCSWAMANMNHGILGNKRILEASSYDLLWHPWHPTREGDHVGLCWIIGEHRGHRIISHSGGDTGFTNDFVMIPDQSLAVVVLCNTHPAPVDKIKFLIMDHLLGFEPGEPKTPASVPVLKALAAKGVEPAVQMWDSLQIHNREAYDFAPYHFYVLLNAMKLDLVEEAQAITQLSLRILSAETIDFIRSQAEWYRDFHRNTGAALAVLDVIRESHE